MEMEDRALSEATDDPWKDLCSTLSKYMQKYLLYRVLVIPGSVPQHPGVYTEQNGADYESPRGIA